MNLEGSLRDTRDRTRRRGCEDAVMVVNDDGAWWLLDDGYVMAF